MANIKVFQEKIYLNIVNDQKGTPTSADAIADVTYKIVKTILKNPNFENFGTYHFALDGETNRYQYACFITDEAIRLGLNTTMTSRDIKPISSDEYSTTAKRPINSRLNTTKIKKTFMLEFPRWKAEVTTVLKTALIQT